MLFFILYIGGWTLVANYSGTDPESGNSYGITQAYIGTFGDLGHVIRGNRGVNNPVFKLLHQIFQFSQIRWYCRHGSGTKFIDITTSLNDKGLAVVKGFFEDTPTTGPCGSFYRLPEDNSQLTQTCQRWHGGKWFSMRSVGDDDRLYHVPFFIGSEFDWIFESPNAMGCDSTMSKSSQEVEAKGVWKVYVR